MRRFQLPAQLSARLAEMTTAGAASSKSRDSASSSSCSSTVSTRSTTSLPSKRESEVSQRNTRKGKSVSFHKSVRVQPVLHVKDYTKEEFAATWYSKSEIVAIRDVIVKAIKEMEAGGATTAETKRAQFLHNRFRGLETRTAKGSSMKGESRMLSKTVVLQEQKRQRQLNISDPDYLALLYKQNSQISKVMAQEMAMDDEEFVSLHARDYRMSSLLNNHQQSQRMKGTFDNN